MQQSGVDLAAMISFLLELSFSVIEKVPHYILFVLIPPHCFLLEVYYDKLIFPFLVFAICSDFYVLIVFLLFCVANHSHGFLSELHCVVNYEHKFIIKDLLYLVLGKLQLVKLFCVILGAKCAHIKSLR